MQRRIVLSVRWSLPLLATLVAFAMAQERTALLLGSSKRAVIVRWVVDIKKYPDGGFNVFRRSAKSNDWQRLNNEPIIPIRNRERARALLGDRYDEMEHLLFAPAMKGLNLRDAIQQEENRGSLALLMADIDAQVAEVLGLRFDDISAEEGELYTYRLTRLDGGTETDVALGEGERSDAEIDPPAGLNGVVKDSLVELVWAPEQRFSGYNVYRSEKKSGTYAKVNISPVLVLETEYEGKAVVPNVFYRDQSALAVRTYWYRVTGITAFAQESERSEEISVDVKPGIVKSAPPKPSIIVRRDSAFLAWTLVKGEGIDGYHIYRAIDKPDSLKRVTNRPVRGVQFVDEGLSERTAYFYAIAAVDEDGNESALSLAVLADVLDFGAPRPPVGITIETDTGKIMLRWQSNTEKDILGYHVFKATKDTLREHFFQATKVPVRQMAFVDQVPRGADYTFYYRLVAVDSAYQFSDFSPIIRGKLPDIVPPIAPIWKAVTVRKDRIELSWTRNPEQDIAGYSVYRRGRGEFQWLKLRDGLLSHEETHFGDTTAVPGNPYEYMLQAIDDAKNVSRQSTVVAARRYDTDPPKAPGLIAVQYDSIQQIISLSWERPSDNTLRGAVVFRSIGATGKFVQRSRLLQASAFTDDDIKKGESYRYRVRTYDTSGNYSDLSEPVIVTTARANK